MEPENEESDLEIDSDDSLNIGSSEEINLPQLIKAFDEGQAVFRDSVFLPPTSPPPTTADCVPAPATTTVSFVPDEADNIRTIPTVRVKNTPKRPQKRKKSFVGFFHKFNFEHF